MGPLTAPPTRRKIVAAAGSALAGWPLAALAGAAWFTEACADQPTLPPGTLVALATLPEGERVRVLHQEEPVELVRTGGEVRARSLFCTHTGCEVRWEAARNLYQCLCHDGRFDATGAVLYGPPTEPLRPIPTMRVGDDRILLLAEPNAPRRG